MIVPSPSRAEANPELKSMACLTNQLAGRIPIITFQGWDGREATPPTSHFTWVWGNLNSGPHGCITNALTTEASPQSLTPVNFRPDAVVEFGEGGNAAAWWASYLLIP